MKKEHILLLLGGLILLGRREATVSFPKTSYVYDTAGNLVETKTETVTVPMSQSPYRVAGERTFRVTDPSGESWWTSCDDTDEAERSLRKVQTEMGRTVVRMG